MANRPSDFVSQTRDLATTLLQTINGLDALRKEWDGMNYLDTLPPEAFEGANSDVTKDEIAAVIGTTLDALNALLDEGHATNLYNVRT